MTLNPDIVRDVLIFLGEKLEFDAINGKTISSKRVAKELSTTTGYNTDDIMYVTHQLYERGFIQAKPKEGANGRLMWCDIYDISWGGHNLLNNIKDDKIWDEVKFKANSMGINSIEDLSLICQNVVRNITNNIGASL